MGRYTQDDGTSPIVGLVMGGLCSLTGLWFALAPGFGIWARVGGVALVLFGVYLMVAMVMMIVRQERRRP